MSRENFSAVKVPDEAYGTGWNGNTEVPTKNAVYDKIESLGGWTLVKKTSDEARQNTTTFADDGALVYTLVANTTYWIRGRIFFDTSANADFKYQINWTQTPQLFRSRGSFVPPITSQANTSELAYAEQTTSSHAVTGPGTNGGFVMLDILVTSHATLSSVLSFQWAQNTSDFGFTTVLKGSHLEILTV